MYTGRESKEVISLTDQILTRLIHYIMILLLLLEAPSVDILYVMIVNWGRH